MSENKTMTLEEAMRVTEADKIKTVLDMAKKSVNSLYDRLVKDIGDTRRRKEQLENALHEATVEAGTIINTIIKGIDQHDKANILANWRMRFKEEQEAITSMVEVNNTSFDKTSELFLFQLDSSSRVTDSSAALSIIFDTVDKASYVYQRKSSFEEKYKDYIPLAAKIDKLSNELGKVNCQLDRSRRDLAYLNDVNNYLFGKPKVSTPANPSSIVEKLRAINIKLASEDLPILSRLVRNPSSMASSIRSIETVMTPQDRFFLMAALVIVTVTR